MTPSWILIFFISAIGAVPTRVTWVNGIGHNLEHMEDGKNLLSHMFGGKEVQFCHNPTAMAHEEDYVGLSTDLLQAGTQKFGWITGEVDELVRHLREAVKSVGKKGVVIHIAHSQGALITSLAAKQLTQEERSHIECICFGGAAAITRAEFPSFKRLVNYYSVNDPLLLVVPSASRRLQSGIFTSVEEDEYVFLTPRSGNPALDHALFGPTYCELVAWEGRRFQNRYQSVLERVTRRAMLKLEVLFAFLLFIIWDCFAKPIYVYTQLRAEEVSEVVLRNFIVPIYNFWKLLMQLVVQYLRTWRDGGKYEKLNTGSITS